MSVVTNLNDRRKEKKRKHEMKLLRQLSLSDIVAQTTESFKAFIAKSSFYKTAMEDICIDLAIDAYLSGAHYSRFGYFGEKVENVRTRAEDDMVELIDLLFDHLMYYRAADDMTAESLYYAIQCYIEYWWNHGFEVGKKRYSLRLT